MSAKRITSLFGSILRVGRASTPPMKTPNGIAELKPIDLNGYPQWLLIRGQDVSSPLLLFLHGGPGESNMWLAHSTMQELEHSFVCVNWDQRGAGKSFRPGPSPESMTIDQFVQDTITLIELLRARFGQQKVLLLGHSWGSVLAMKVAAARPDLLYAVIGMGQVVAMQRGEDLSYRYVLERVHAEHNRKAIRILEQLGGSDTYRKDSTFVQRRWLVRYGGMVHRLDTGAMVSILLNAPECSIADCIRGLTRRDMKFSCRLMGDEIMGVNVLQEIPELAVPVFFFVGSYDYTTPGVLVEQFYASLQAPDPAKLAFGAGVEVFVRRGQLMMRILSPILPMLYRGFPLHPDDDNDPYIFRVDLSTFGFGIGTGRVIFSREHEVGTTAVHCEFGPLSFQKQPASKNPRLWAAVA